MSTTYKGRIEPSKVWVRVEHGLGTLDPIVETYSGKTRIPCHVFVENPNVVYVRAGRYDRHFCWMSMRADTVMVLT